MWPQILFQLRRASDNSPIVGKINVKYNLEKVKNTDLATLPSATFELRSLTATGEADGFKSKTITVPLNVESITDSDGIIALEV